MKQKCNICSNAKGQRGCLLKGMTLICPRCCAETRNSECEGCSYYKDSQKFAIEKSQKSPRHFTIRLAPEVDDEIDRALRMVEAGNIADGEFVIRSLMKDNADLYTLHFAMGTIHGFKGQYDEAIACFDKSIEIYPYYVDSWFNRAISAQKKLDIIEMVCSLRKVIELGDIRDEAVGKAKGLLGDFEQITYKETGLKLDEYVVSLKKFNAAFELMQDKQWEKAIVGYKEAIIINPTAPQTYGNMGLCYAHLNEEKKAMEAFDKAIALDPTYEPAIINRAIFKETVTKGLQFSETQTEVKVIEYIKDYSLKDNKLLINDYLNNEIK
jgi:tetratricopeptide (TPR) repeat protein